MTPATTTFVSDGTTCEAWHYVAAHEGLATDAGRPVVVMAHGLGGTKDSGLAPFAEGFAAAGLDVLLFDYRGFGGSGGSPRQVVSLEAQLADYRAAMAGAATLPGVDPQRIVLWGVSLAGGHVLRAAADRTDVAAVVSVVPMVDGLAAARHATATHSTGELLRATGRGIRSRVSARAGRSHVMMPIVARPGEVGAMTLPGALEDYLAIAGPTWRNEIAADVGLELGSRKPQAAAAHLQCPLLVQIADFDQSAPPYAAAKAAFKGKAEVRHYPCDHFDVFAGKPWHESTLSHAVAFLTRHLSKDLTNERETVDA
ncbi:alpha/beta hydrolase [Nocardioides stalactiti]|uniref:alpha/beta hydrolase n=1 Tax=Nocardioides stalactiti TaxID=2755356 RepID=UPI0016004205|nr:alpha/beta hydrolase [Nocardioides stalactiti]